MLLLLLIMRVIVTTDNAKVARDCYRDGGLEGAVALDKVFQIAAAAQQACAVVAGDGGGEGGGEAGELVCWGCAQGGRLGVCDFFLFFC